MPMVVSQRPARMRWGAAVCLLTADGVPVQVRGGYHLVSALAARHPAQPGVGHRRIHWLAR